jgi:hypothetical protein
MPPVPDGSWPEWVLEIDANSPRSDSGGPKFGMIERLFEPPEAFSWCDNFEVRQRQLELFPRDQLARMRDRTKSRRHSAEAERFRCEHKRDRDWGLAQRHGLKLWRLRRERAAAASEALATDGPEAGSALNYPAPSPVAQLAHTEPPSATPEGQPPSPAQPTPTPEEQPPSPAQHVSALEVPARDSAQPALAEMEATDPDSAAGQSTHTPFRRRTHYSLPDISVSECRKGRHHPEIAPPTAPFSRIPARTTYSRNPARAAPDWAWSTSVPEPKWTGNRPEADQAAETGADRKQTAPQTRSGPHSSAGGGPHSGAGGGPSSRAGSRPPSRAGSRPPSRAGSRPPSRAGSGPHSRAGSEREIAAWASATRPIPEGWTRAVPSLGANSTGPCRCGGWPARPGCAWRVSLRGPR